MKTVDFSETIEGQGHFFTIYFSRFCMFCALLGQDIRIAFTGPLVLWFYFADVILSSAFLSLQAKNIMVNIL